MNRAGAYVSNLTGEATYTSYRPAPLPPNPAIEIDEQMAFVLAAANQKLAELDTLARHIPDVSLFHVSSQGSTYFFLDRRDSVYP